MEVPIIDEGFTLDDMSDDYHFAAAVASFGMLLRHSAYAGNANFDTIREWARSGNRGGHPRRSTFIDLLAKAQRLSTAASGAVHPVRGSKME